MDIFDSDKRSEIMARVRSANTAPEIRVRKLLHAFGYRFRLHRKDLPGSPDIVFPGRKSVIFVHGCFWHRHEGCAKASRSSTRVDFWDAKFAENVARDKRNIEALKTLGWRILVIWECEAGNEEILIKKLKDFLEMETAGGIC